MQIAAVYGKDEELIKGNCDKLICFGAIALEDIEFFRWFYKKVRDMKMKQCLVVRRNPVGMKPIVKIVDKEFKI